MKYNKYKNVDFKQIFDEFEKTEMSLKDLELKYNIPKTTIQSRYYKYNSPDKRKTRNIKGGNKDFYDDEQIYKKRENVKSDQNIKNEENSKKFMKIFDKNCQEKNKKEIYNKPKVQNLFTELNKINPEFTKYD
jgi:hypothetical protein